jgi:hypothetical protein
LSCRTGGTAEKSEGGSLDRRLPFFVFGSE